MRLGNVLLIILVILSIMGGSYSLQNSKVKRLIDLSSQLARHTIEIILLNDEQEKVDSYYITIPVSLSSKLSYIQAITDENSNLPIYQKSDTSTVNNIQYNMFVVNFGTPILKGQEKRLVLYFVFAHAMAVYPDEITQNERQLVKYSDNHYFFSPYLTEEIITTVKLASSSVQSHTEKAPSIIKGDTIQYGIYKSVPPFSFSSLSIHFENNRPFLTITKFLRLIEISHWGNVAVEDHISMKNDGAKLKGSFSRYDYQINPQANGQSALKFLRQFLPAEAADTYYRDDIGNISTSFLNMDDDDKLRLEIRPRFPLFGGWKPEFYMGYNLPTESCLFIDSNGNYLLNTTLIANWDVGVTIDEAEVRIIFPEGSSKIKVSGTPFIVDISNSTHFTYLDFFGRPVLILKKTNLVNEHHQHFQATYSFSSISLLLEPMLLIGGYATILIAIILIRRIDLTITVDK